MSEAQKSSTNLLYAGLSRAIDSCYVFETAQEKALRLQAYQKELSEGEI